MENNIITDSLLATNSLSIGSITLSICLSFFLSYLLSKVYKSQAKTLSNPEDLASIFPFLSIGVTIIIIVVKSSLALSLGLVGALSIVRFRTPIKEPEELTYIFLCIGIGIATGANQYKVAYIGVLLTTVFIYFYNWLKKGENKKSKLSIYINGIQTSELNNLIELVKEYSLKIDFHNMSVDSNKTDHKASLSLAILGSDFEKLTNLVNDMKYKYPQIDVNIVDSSTLY